MAVDPGELVDHLDELYRFALGMTRDPSDASDVVQETVLRALERGDQYRGDAPLGHWLVRIAHNLVRDRNRRSGREILVDDVEDAWRDDAYSVDAAAVVERAATREELEDALARLPFIYRSAVLLHDVLGRTTAEIARLHGVTLPAAKQRLRRGRMALVHALAKGEERRALTRGVPMRCWDARRHVSDYLNGDLAPAIAATVERHLAACPTCPPLYAALVGVHDGLGSLRDPDAVIPPEVARSIRARLAR